MNTQQARFEELLKKIEEAKQSGTVDLSHEEDLSIAIMNLVSLEEHFFFTGAKTNKPEYFDLLDEVRAMRKELLAQMIPTHEGETWCVSKHLLAATMRLIEVGAKLQSNGDKEKAQEVFDKAHTLYSLFFGLRLKLIDTTYLKQKAASEGPWTLQDIVSKLVDCCDE